ncbi:DUF4097 family beta strand repeat-containing protein [Actinoplanes sp. N902-109]|uniref:DUF4097 family beta strand repeat-containing protein n=1 Tax=Actinoplanes sp. (strain N902-109) TaxID=649831 RepID=UPI0003295224|nr:DUF4097 family beta strand repeat-containing protein [Actinoplanes sp. N902-109]AGL15105.1 lipoprotein [Actinoplanes sp. N902-109]
MKAKLLIVAAAAVVLAGCDGGIGARLTYDDTEQAKITEIVVSGGSGDVSISTAAGTATRIKRVVRSNGHDPGRSYSVSGSTLTVDTSCGSNCSVSYEIQAPTGVTVRGGLRSGGLALAEVGTADVSVTSGNIRLDRITGAVTARATAGNIVAHALSGPATLAATSGNIEGFQLTGGRPVSTETRSGNVKLQLVQAASVRAHTTNGNVELVVPNGDYQVRDDVGNGDFHTNLRADAGAANVIDVHTSNGNIKVMGS